MLVNKNVSKVTTNRISATRDSNQPREQVGFRSGYSTTDNKQVGFEFKPEKVILTLFNALVHSYLEHCIEFWSPYYQKETLIS